MLSLVLSRSSGAACVHTVSLLHTPIYNGIQINFEVKPSSGYQLHCHVVRMSVSPWLWVPFRWAYYYYNYKLASQSVLVWVEIFRQQSQRCTNPSSCSALTWMGTYPEAVNMHTAISVCDMCFQCTPLLLACKQWSGIRAIFFLLLCTDLSY